MWGQQEIQPGSLCCDSGRAHGSRQEVGGVCVNDQTLKFRPHSLSKRKFLKPSGMPHTNFSLDRMTALWVSVREFLDKVS